MTGIVFDVCLEQIIAYCGQNKAKVIYEARRSAPPAFASLGSFTLKFRSSDTYENGLPGGEGSLRTRPE